MKYKIVIVNFKDEACTISALYSDNSYCTIDHTNLNNYEEWVDLGLYGVHIFECDDLYTFDLLKAQEDAQPKTACDSEEEAIVEKLIAHAKQFNEKRKAEIKRIAERHYIDNGVELSCAIEMAIGFVDKFDFEFDRLERGE